MEKLAKIENAICKPSIDSGGGKKIIFMDKSMSEQHKLTIVKSIPDVVVQEIVAQHESLSVFNPDSLNTIRLVTFITKEGDIVVLSSAVRMGVNNKRLDNAHSGGIFVGIDGNGCMRKMAHDLKGSSYSVHPTSRVPFCGYSIKGYSQCKKIVKQLAPKFYGLSRLISWDMAISETEEPILIEANMTFGGCDIPQISNGPLFGDYTLSMIKEVFDVKKNKLRAWLI